MFYAYVRTALKKSVKLWTQHLEAATLSDCEYYIVL
jgi:hypothetical protein